MAGILKDVRIIDFTRGHLGSYGTMLLSDFGAEVIKIEDYREGGDIIRNLFPKNEKGERISCVYEQGKEKRLRRYED